MARADSLGAQPVPGWVLLPLRAFLGVTFVFAGLEKLSDHNYLASAAPTSVRSQLQAYSQRSPIGGVLTVSAHHATAVGLAIALGELAVGLGALLGLWTRAAAVGGMLLSASFLLSVSWHAHPYYLGPDIVFLFAWTPLALAGAGSRWSLDEHLREESRAELRVPPQGPVSVEFATVRRLCGAYDKGRCRARGGAACAPGPCPVLAERSPLAPVVARELDRRTFLRQAGVAARVAAGGLLLAGATGGLGRLLAGGSGSASATTRLGPLGGAGGGGLAGAGAGASSATTTPTGAASTTSPTSPATEAAPSPSTTAAAATPSGTPIGDVSVLQVGGAGTFLDPLTQRPGIVTHPADGQYQAFSAVCTHQGCEVGFSRGVIACPCHGATFDPRTGAVLQGPADRPLPPIRIAVAQDGQLYVQS